MNPLDNRVIEWPMSVNTVTQHQTLNKNILIQALNETVGGEITAKVMSRYNELKDG